MRPPIASVVGLLTLAYVLSYVDRTILSLLVGPIRSDLAISDTQFSLLHGLAFALFYTLMGIPFGRWADTGDRRVIIAFGIAVWSAMTALCGLARSFALLFIARTGVGVGEAALSPAAYSLIADLVPRKKLGQALAVYSSGVYVGIGLTFLGGGWLIEAITAAGPIDAGPLGVLAPWQQTFLLLGGPGLVLALLLYWKLPEPRGNRLRVSQEAPAPSVLPHIRRHRTFLLCHFLGFSSLTMMFNGYLTWAPEFMLRTYAWDRSTTGLWLGLSVLIGGTAGMLSGGRIADIFAEKNVKASAMAAALLGIGALALFPWWATLTATPGLAIAGLAGIVTFSAFTFGPAITALQLATPPRLRGILSAIYLFWVNLFGIGLGGTAVALVSDHLLQDETRIGEAMAYVGCAGVLCALLLVFTAYRTTPEHADD